MRRHVFVYISVSLLNNGNVRVHPVGRLSTKRLGKDLTRDMPPHALWQYAQLAQDRLRSKGIRVSDADFDLENILQKDGGIITFYYPREL